jgi:Domain of unknown function (DUF4234)
MVTDRRWPWGYRLTMSDDVPPPPPDAPAPPPPSSVPTPPPPPGAPAGYAMVPAGRVPERLGGAFYSPGLVILLTIVTLGIWGIFWTYRTNEDLKKYNGDGIGGVLGIVIYILLSVVLMFTIPNEIKNSYERDGRQSPVRAVWGLWFLLPLIGNIIWYLKVQSALNRFWESKGAQQG